MVDETDIRSKEYMQPLQWKEKLQVKNSGGKSQNGKRKRGRERKRERDKEEKVYEAIMRRTIAAH